VAALEATPRRVRVSEEPRGDASREFPDDEKAGKSPCDHGTEPGDQGLGVGTGSMVRWDYTNASDLEPGVPRVPCASLLHELYHAYEDATGTAMYNMSPMGVSYTEAMATAAENRYRASQGLPLRTRYGDRALRPLGDPLCSAGGICCDKACYDDFSDSSHCGGCATRCAAGQQCSNSVCTCSASSCQGECCGDACLDLTSDPANCGFCGNPCPPQSTCENGLCSATCVPCFTRPLTAGCCPSDLPYCTIYNGYNAVCCTGDNSRCGCPSGYVGCQNSCVPAGACL